MHEFKELFEENRRAVLRPIRVFLIFLALKVISDIAGEQDVITRKWPILSMILPLTLVILIGAIWTLAYLPIMIDAAKEPKPNHQHEAQISPNHASDE